MLFFLLYKNLSLTIKIYDSANLHFIYEPTDKREDPSMSLCHLFLSPSTLSFFLYMNFTLINFYIQFVFSLSLPIFIIQYKYKSKKGLLSTPSTSFGNLDDDFEAFQTYNRNKSHTNPF